MSGITMDTTLGEVAELTEFCAFGEHVMVCRPATWERMRAKPIVSAAGQAARNSYGVQRIVRGFNRIRELVCSGQRVAYDFWNEAELAEDPSRQQTKLFFMPGVAGAPFTLVISGGAYRSVCNNVEGFPTAPELNDAGYNVFVLSYRVGSAPLMPKPIDDVARALKFILEHAEKFAISHTYAVMGFSAGGHLAAEWGTSNFGYEMHGLPAPRVLVLCYAALDFRQSTDVPDRQFLETMGALDNPSASTSTASCDMSGRVILQRFCGTAPTTTWCHRAISPPCAVHLIALAFHMRRSCSSMAAMRL